MLGYLESCIPARDCSSSCAQGWHSAGNDPMEEIRSWNLRNRHGRRSRSLVEESLASGCATACGSRVLGELARGGHAGASLRRGWQDKPPFSPSVSAHAERGQRAQSMNDLSVQGQASTRSASALRGFEEELRSDTGPAQECVPCLHLAQPENLLTNNCQESHTRAFIGSSLCKNTPMSLFRRLPSVPPP